MKHFDAHTTREQLKVIRHFAVAARRLVYDIDEGRSADPVFAHPYHVDGTLGASMNTDVRELISSLDSAIIKTAEMQERLDSLA